MLAPTAVRLSKLDNIIGIKEATGDISRCQEILAGCREGFLLISGDDATAMEFMLAGGKGVITVTGNVAPRLFHTLCMACLEGERDQGTAGQCQA